MSLICLLFLFFTTYFLLIYAGFYLPEHHRPSFSTTAKSVTYKEQYYKYAFHDPIIKSCYLAFKHSQDDTIECFLRDSNRFHNNTTFLLLSYTSYFLPWNRRTLPVFRSTGSQQLTCNSWNNCECPLLLKTYFTKGILVFMNPYKISAKTIPGFLPYKIHTGF